MYNESHVEEQEGEAFEESSIQSTEQGWSKAELIALRHIFDPM